MTPRARTRPPRFGQVLGLQSRLLREHPGLLVTVGYLVMSLVGMMFNRSLFERFGVDIFDYAEVTDFLMAALREPLTFVVAAGGIVVAWGIWWWSNVEQRFFARRPPRSWFFRHYARWSRWSAHSSWVLLAIIPLYAGLFIEFYAEYRAKEIRAGEGERVRVTQEVDAGSRERVLLGTTGKFVFLLDPASEKVEILPFEAVYSIETLAPTKEDDDGEPDSAEGPPEPAATESDAGD